MRRNVSPLAHYLAHRRTQRVSPSPLFDLAFHLDRHGDEIGGNRDPFMHHVRHGAALRDLDPSPGFDAAAYRRTAMAGDTREWTGLTAHEMHVPLVHHLAGAVPPKDAREAAAKPARRFSDSPARKGGGLCVRYSCLSPVNERRAR